MEHLVSFTSFYCIQYRLGGKGLICNLTRASTRNYIPALQTASKKVMYLRCWHSVLWYMVLYWYIQLKYKSRRTNKIILEMSKKLCMLHTFQAHHLPYKHQHTHTQDGQYMITSPEVSLTRSSLATLTT